MRARTIGLHDLQIQTIDGSCSINIGRARMVGSHVVNHRNEGFGEQSADGVIRIKSVSIVEDSDVMDTNAIKNMLL
ncbi:hypothetical protein DCC39_00720 [Pueribacillus theae]|uniref:Uncharacterized protein n=1 Tax=Pueribacillus theae TaxID=2171751 RepID=A0A2U1K7E2_9BACI|nr:hypothetical protein [Pueribacillus theae]PWA13447.1 hypothetical protein DCC39_00720 [Pueribacillus theae]